MTLKLKNRPDKVEWAMGLAAIVSARSTCLRRAVGCVLLDAEGRVLSTGYNGRAAGLKHCNKFDPMANGIDDAQYPHACSGACAESGQDLDACDAVHAEANALLQCSDVLRLHTCVVTTAPCVSCTKMLLNTPCQRVVWHSFYPASGRTLWKRLGREWLQFQDDLGWATRALEGLQRRAERVSQ